MAEAPLMFTDGAAYERFMGPWTVKVGAAFLDWMAPAPGLRWLEAGCGTGIFTEMLLDRCAPSEVIAIDPAPAQIEQARQKPVARRADFRVADLATYEKYYGTHHAPELLASARFILPELTDPRWKSEIKLAARRPRSNPSTSSGRRAPRPTV